MPQLKDVANSQMFVVNITLRYLVDQGKTEESERRRFTRDLVVPGRRVVLDGSVSVKEILDSNSEARARRELK